MQKGGLNSKTLIILSTVISLLVVVAGCNTNNNAENSGNYSSTYESIVDSEETGRDISLSLRGISGEEIILKQDDLENFEQIKIYANTIDSKNNEITKSVTGVDLNTILSGMGQNIMDYKLITLIASDGYTISVNQDIIALRRIIISLEIDGKKRNPGIAIPDERSMYWVMDLSVIEFEKSLKQSAAEGIYFFESMVEIVENYNYKVSGQNFKSVKLSDITALMNVSQIEYINTLSSDGFKKSLKYIDYEYSYIRYEGEYSPFLGFEEMPIGMTVKYLSNMNFGDAVLLLKSYETDNLDFKGEVDGQEGILLSKIFDTINITQAPVYIFTANDGYSVTIESKDIAKGIIFKADDGTVSVKFDGLPKNTSVRKLMTIKTGE